jgi:hypothetical protein
MSIVPSLAEVRETRTHLSSNTNIGGPSYQGFGKIGSLTFTASYEGR